MASTSQTLRILTSRLSRSFHRKSRPFSTTALASIQASQISRKTFEPDYLDATKHLPEMYPPVNIQIKGYDFVILESYQKYIHNLAENMGIDVSEAWSTPCMSQNVKVYEPNTSNIKDTFDLNYYERNVQVANMRSIDAPLLLDILLKTLPQGVEMSVHEHKEEFYEARFIPDPFLDGIKQELKDMDTQKELEIADSAEKRAIKEARKEERKLQELYASFDDEDDEDDDF